MISNCNVLRRDTIVFEQRANLGSYLFCISVRGIRLTEKPGATL